jgi:bile acid-coenzyme A ligase
MGSTGLVSIAERLAEMAVSHPDRVLLECGEAVRTASEVETNSNRLANHFARLGVKESDFVTLALPNCVEFIESVFATWKLGATPQPVSPRLPGTELEAVVDLADPSLVIGVDPSRIPNRTVLPIDFTVPAATPTTRQPIRFSRFNRAPTSGGSTGRPKLIIDRRPAAVYDDPMLPTNGATVIPGPMYHAAPFQMATRSIMRGNHTVMFPKFDPEAVLAAVARTEAQFLYSVPTMLSRMWKLDPQKRDRHDLSSLKVLLHTAAPCPEWLKREWIGKVGDVLTELYASSEGAVKLTIRGNEWLTHPGSVGKPRGDDRIKILDDDGNEVPTGTIGNVYMRSMGERDFEYRGAERTDTADGFTTVGDMGHVDAEGYLYLADRRSDLIIRGGANIFPAEVEAALEEHPSVRSVAVVGIPDDDLGKRVHAVIDAPNGADEAALRSFIAGRLVAYKCPETYEFVDGPVRDEAGKVRRLALATRAHEQNSRERTNGGQP